MAPTEPDASWMRAALTEARAGIAAGQTPFGAAIVRDGTLIAAAHNLVWATTDITAHAEVQAIRQGCAALGAVDLSGCTIYSTCEPCPMCFAACHWARLDRIVYGATIADAAAAGFRELAIPNADMKRLGGSPILLTAGVLAAEARELFDLWKRQGRSRAY